MWPTHLVGFGLAAPGRKGERGPRQTILVPLRVTPASPKYSLDFRHIRSIANPVPGRGGNQQERGGGQEPTAMPIREVVVSLHLEKGDGNGVVGPQS